MRAPPAGRSSLSRLRIATAGWSIPRTLAEAFPAQGQGLERYAARFDAVEINTTFYRSHRSSTYARWPAATPAQFRFAVKLPRTITHAARLADADALVTTFRAEVTELGDQLGPLLVQLPPSLAFDPGVANRFFTHLRAVWPETIVCEPRHPSWFAPDAEALLIEHRVARVAADPAPHAAGGPARGWRDVAYWRLHGAPKIYYSPYDEGALRNLYLKCQESSAREIWIVFDNTASGAALANALALQVLARQ